MISVLNAIICVSALIATLIFESNTLLCMLAAAAAGVLLAAQLLLPGFKTLKKYLTPLLTAALLGFCFYMPSSVSDYGSRDYDKLASDYYQSLEDGDTKEASKLKKSIIKKYGETDEVLMVSATEAVNKGDIAEAEEYADKLYRKTGESYYMLLETITAAKYADSDEFADRMLEVYKQAADSDPRMVYMNASAGILYFDRGEFGKANYYLLNAVNYSEEADPVVLYYLGASLVELGMYDKGLDMLELAAENDPGDELMSNIMWYAQKAGLEVD